MAKKEHRRGRFSDEEVESNRTYPKGYKPKGITAQVRLLCKLFPNLDPADMKVSKKPPPKGAEAFFVIPKWQAVAKTYREALERVFELIKEQRSFYNWCKNRLEEQYLRRCEKTAKSLQSLAEQQKGHDILVIACQFGLFRRGMSIRRAKEVFKKNEFGLGVFEIGIMLLTHPERLVDPADLWVNCPGDEYDLDAGGRFNRTPYFRFCDDEVEVVNYWSFFPEGAYGSASAFLP